MPCLVGCLALVAPRVALVLVWLFGDYLERVYETAIWPILGFLFMPVTTLAYAWAWHIEPQGYVKGVGLVVVVIAVLMDLGIIGGNARGKKRVRGFHAEIRED
ncbi:MAG: hypothetical protein ACYS99_04395 [Planctomycetota bacterium]|jgi:hypothetical protein